MVWVVVPTKKPADHRTRIRSAFRPSVIPTPSEYDHGSDLPRRRLPLRRQHLDQDIVRPSVGPGIQVHAKDVFKSRHRQEVGPDGAGHHVPDGALVQARIACHGSYASISERITKVDYEAPHSLPSWIGGRCVRPLIHESSGRLTRNSF